MALFYIDCSEGILELNSTSEISVTENSSVTKHKLESGDTITDNVVTDNVMIKFSGIISDIKTIRQKYTDEQRYGSTVEENDYDEPVKQYLNALRRVKNNKELFKVRYDYRFPSLSNCVLTNLDISRDVSMESGYKVALSFEQVRISARARLETNRTVQRKADLTQGKTEGGGNNTEENKDVSGPVKSLFSTGLFSVTNTAQKALE